MNLKFKKTLFCISGLASFAFIAPLIGISINITQNSKITELVSIKATDNDIYTEAKLDPLFKVETIRKVRNDNEAINLLFIGNGYGADTSTTLFNTFLKTKIIDPWFSNPQTNGVGLNDRQYHYPNVMWKNMGVINPYTGWLNDRFNVYLVKPTDNLYNTNNNNLDTFLGIHKDSRDGLYSLVNNYSLPKTHFLINDINNKFLYKNGLIKTNHASIVTKDIVGRANAYGRKYALLSSKDSLRTYQHELGHSIYGLSDEYRSDNEGPNNATDLKLAQEKWGPFVGFRGVNYYPKNDTKENWYIPTDASVMKAYTGYYPNVSAEFGEVNNYHMNKIVAQELQKELLYIADPQFIKFNTNDNLQTTLDYLKAEIFDFNLDTLNNNNYKFNTVVSNLTNKTRNLKLVVKITDKENKDKYSKASNVYTLKPQSGPIQLELSSDSPMSNLQNTDHIMASVVDNDTKEILATNWDRRNKVFNFDIDKYKENSGKRQFKLTINFKDVDTKKPLEGISESTIVQREDTNYNLNKILFNGYRFVNSSDNDMKVTFDQNYEVDFYYKKLNHKTITLNLKSNNNKSTVKTKTLKIYEGQTFRPSSNDFYVHDINDLKITNNLSNNVNNTWTSSAIPENPKPINYNDIKDGSQLNYWIENKPNIHINAVDRLFQQGYIPTYGDLRNNKYLFTYKYDFNNLNDSSPKIIYNNTDYNTPGSYNIWYYYDSNIKNNGQNLSSRVYKHINVFVTPNSENSNLNLLDGEISRLKSIEYLNFKDYEDKDIPLTVVNTWNENNILDQINNLSLNNKYKYKIIDFSLKPTFNNDSDLYTLKFKINVSIGSMNDNTFEYDKSFRILKENIDQSLINEVDRINKITLSFKNNITENEYNSLNSSNLLLSLNGWSTTNNFKYDIVNFQNNSNGIVFNIKVLYNNQTLLSKQFEIPKPHFPNKPISPFPPPQQISLEKIVEKLNKTTYLPKEQRISNSDFNNINNQNINQYINSLPLSDTSMKYEYEIVDKKNNSLKFKIKVTDLKTSESKYTILFSTSFQVFKESASSNNVPLIVGATLGSIAGLAIFAGFGYWWYRKKK